MPEWLKLLLIVVGAYTLVGVSASVAITIWRYFTDRSGNSGRHKHWTEED